MSKSHFDDIDLEQPGIEADEINTEAASAGQVLVADGLGGAVWGHAGAALCRMFNDSEATISSGSWIVLTDLTAEIEDTGFSLDEASGEITIGTEIDGKVLHYDLLLGVLAASQTGSYTVTLQQQVGGIGGWLTVNSAAAVVDSSEGHHAQVTGFDKLSAGDKYRVRVTLNLSPAGSADFDLNSATVALLAL